MSKLIRSGYLPDKFRKDMHFKKNDIFRSPQTNLSDKIDVSKKLIPQGAILSTSPYAMKHTRSQKALDRIKIVRKYPLIKKNTRIFHNSDKSFTSEGMKLVNSFSFLSTDEASKIDTRDFALMKKSSEMLDRLEKAEESGRKFEIFQSVFTEITEKDKDFGIILKLIKKEYERILRSQKSELDLVKTELTESQALKKILNSELEKFIHENKELTVKFEELHRKYTEVSDQFLKIATVDNSKVEMNEENWIRILRENKMYEELLYNSKKDLGYYKLKSRKMMKLLVAFEEKGYPVEEIYNNEVKKKKQLPKYHGNDDAPDDTDNEDIVSGGARHVKKPGKIPHLDLSIVEPNSFTSESATDSYNACSSNIKS